MFAKISFFEIKLSCFYYALSFLVHIPLFSVDTWFLHTVIMFCGLHCEVSKNIIGFLLGMSRFRINTAPFSKDSMVSG